VVSARRANIAVALLALVVAVAMRSFRVDRQAVPAMNDSALSRNG
jgi:hypothetical protein